MQGAGEERRTSLEVADDPCPAPSAGQPAVCPSAPPEPLSRKTGAGGVGEGGRIPAELVIPVWPIAGKILRGARAPLSGGQQARGGGCCAVRLPAAAGARGGAPGDEGQRRPDDAEGVALALAVDREVHLARRAAARRQRWPRTHRQPRQRPAGRARVGWGERGLGRAGAGRSASDWARGGRMRAPPSSIGLGAGWQARGCRASGHHRQPSQGPPPPSNASSAEFDR